MSYLKTIFKNAIVISSLFLLVLLGLRSKAETFVIPHILETSGRITGSQNTFDTTIFATYTAGLFDSQPSSGATIDLYLFDQLTGDLLLSKTGDEVCNPCSFDLDSNSKKLTIKIEDLIREAGGISKNQFGGYGFLTTNSNRGDVKLNYSVEASQKSRSKTSILALEHKPLSSVCPVTSRIRENKFQAPEPDFKADVSIINISSDSCASFSIPGPPCPPPDITDINPASFDCIPYLIPIPPKSEGEDNNNGTMGGFIPGPGDVRPEPGKFHYAKQIQKERTTTSNSTCNNKNIFDTTIVLLNVNGINDNTFREGFVEKLGGSETQVDFYLFNDDGTPMKSASNQVICSPCQINLGTDVTRKSVIKVDDLISNSGGFTKPLVTGFAIIVVNSDPDNVSVQSFVTNTTTGPFDLSVFGFNPEVLEAVP
jgi:hypothetical protein